jgi:hypothetical protein
MMTTIGVWIAALLTLAIFSFLYKDNPFYKIGENIFVGVSAGYWAVYLWFNFAWPNLFQPLLKGHNFWYIIPVALGLLMFTQLIPKANWLVRLPLTFTMGIGLGLAIIATIQGDILPQLQATFVPLRGVGWFTALSNLLLVAGVIATLIYFYFSKEHTGVLGIGAQVGIWFIMIAFGASFGYTVMARISLLIGRMYFLLHNWLGVIR